MGACGYTWVCMGVFGYTNTYAQENNPKRYIHRLVGYDSRPCMDGKFPQKIHICAHGHKGVRRYSGGWGWVQMGVGGCISTQQTQNKAKRGTDRPAGRDLARVCGGEITCQGWRGRHMSVTDHIGELWGCKGCPGTPHAPYNVHDACAQGKTRKKSMMNKITGHVKVIKTQKEIKQHKMFKK